jgi:hypothetical protein
MGLIQDLYAFQKDNQTFLHTRFGLSGDVLKPYKETLERWLSPDVLQRPNRPFPITGRLLANLPDWRS